MENRSGGRRARLIAGVFALVVLAGGSAVGAQAVPAAAKAASAALPQAADLQISPLVPVEAAAESKPAALPRGSDGLRNGTAPNVFSDQWPAEAEPNGTPAQATPLVFNASGYTQTQANIMTAGDVDFFSFTAQAGDRVYAATYTAANSSSNADSQLELLASDGTTRIEFDDDDGSLTGVSSSIAGATLAAAGTYYLRVNQFNADNFLRPYLLHVRLQSGAPTPEVEPNDTPGTANALPANGWVSGTRDPALATEQDWYSFTANAGDTVYLSLDMDPERDNVQWDGRLGIALFGDANNQILVVNDLSTGSAINPLSEALFFTIKTSGTYFAFVDSASPAVGGPAATYTLSVSVAPPPQPAGQNCTTYTSTDVPKTIGPTPGLVSSVITVPGNPRIADVDVDVVLNHALMQDVDVHLRSPAGNDIGLFTDIGVSATGGQSQLDVTFDDEAAIVPAFTVLRPLRLKPELAYRLSWLDGEDAGGTWTLDLRDDVNNASGGTLTSWSLTICEAPPPPACAPGFGPATVFSTDFESGAAGFTYSGTADEWELGLPATLATTTTNPIAAFNTCASGVNCWKTDLDGTYEINNSQDLLSPAINLGGFSAPVVVNWSQRYQMESASFDHFFVDAQQVGGATPVRLFEHDDATMIDAPGNPPVNIGASSGWSRRSARADSLAGLAAELRFHVDGDNTVNMGGAAIDDVSVTACRALISDLSITKTDGVTTAAPGGSVTYTITASNAGPDPASSAAVADTFPAVETCTWTCVGAGGGTCTAAGSGNINDTTVNLPAGGSVTYTASCAINASASGTLSNTATVSSGNADTDPANNSATDTDTLTPQADLSITNTDGVTSVAAGTSTAYTITTRNAGPSNAPGTSVTTDTVPAGVFQLCTWSCVGSGGGTCSPTGSGPVNDTVNLPAGGSVTHTMICNVNPAATGTITQTASVAAPAGVPDPVPGNNSAADTDTVTTTADLAVFKTNNSFIAYPGTSTVYTISARNMGPSSVTGALVIDTLPPSLTCSWTCAGQSGGTCTASGSGSISDLVNLPVASLVVYTASCAISASATGALSNSVSIQTPNDPDAGNNYYTDTDIVMPVADLSISKTDGVTLVNAGGSTTYTIIASNAGPNPANGATVSDTFPAALACSWTCTGAGGGSCTASGSGNISDAVNLPAGASVTYTASCAISPAATGSLVNTATVASPNGTPDLVPANNSATDIDALGASADLSITKTDGIASIAAGGSTTYFIVASNAGPSPATSATVSDAFPAGLSCTWVCSGSGGGTCTASGSGDIDDEVDLPAGGSVSYVATCAVGAAAGTLTNTAFVTAPPSATDTNPANNSASDTDAVIQVADLSITKTDGLTNVAAGGSTTYTLVASNAGPSTDVVATVFDPFPAGLACSWTCAGSGGASCAASGAGDIADTTVLLPAGGSATYTAVCAVAVAASGTLSNTASVTAASVNDPNTANNVATDTTAIDAAGALVTGSKTVSGVIFTPGGGLTYSIVLSNSGGAQADNPGDEFTDVLPGQLQLIAASATSGAAVANAGTGTVTWNGAIPAGGSVTLTITASVRPGASGTVSNQGSFAYDADADGINEASGVTDDPGVGGAADATLFVITGVVPSVPIPALSAWALLLLALGLAGLAAQRRMAPRRG